MPSLVALNQVSLRRPGTGVDLHAERRHGEGVDDVGAGDLHADHLVHRHDNLVIDGEQARLSLCRATISEIELELAVVRIGVGPEPLLAGGLDA